MAKSNSSSPFMCMKGPTDSRTSIFLGSKLLWHETGIVHSLMHHRRSLQTLCVTGDRSKSLKSIKLQFLLGHGLARCWFLSALLLDHYCLEQGLLFALFLSSLNLFPNHKFGLCTEESLSSLQLAWQQETYHSKQWIGNYFGAHFKIPWS